MNENIKNMLWVEKYRPKTIDDCILPKHLKKLFKEYVNKGEIPNLLLYGRAGVGKTTVAKALCDEVGLDYLFINGSDESGIDTFRNKIKTYASSLSISGGKKVIIIDEAEYLNPNSTQPALRSAMEEFSSNCTFIFTCNNKTRIIEPLHSRCAVIDFDVPTKEFSDIAMEFFNRTKKILSNEQIEYDEKVLVTIIKKFFPDFRRVLNELQRYSQFGKIDSGLLSAIGNRNIEELINFIRDKNFGNIRKWVATNDVSTEIFRELYDNLYEYLELSSIPKAVVIINEYQYKHAFVSDVEINLVACITEILLYCDVK